jgi:hypothetical protein
MFKKLLSIFAITISLSAHAGSKDGLFVRYTIQNESKDQVMQGTIDYFYQNRNFLNIINVGGNMMGEMVFLELNGKKYSLFPQEKTYVETKEFTASLSTFHPPVEGEYAPTGIKKKILGYKCEIFTKQNKTMTTNVCLSSKLYKNWGVVVNKMEHGNETPTSFKGFPLEIVTIHKNSNKQTSITMSAIRQKDYRKKFDILSGYKKKEGVDVQKNSTEMIKGMPTTVPTSQHELNKMEKLTEEMQKKYK